MAKTTKTTSILLLLVLSIFLLTGCIATPRKSAPTHPEQLVAPSLSQELGAATGDGTAISSADEQELDALTADIDQQDFDLSQLDSLVDAEK